MLKKFTSPLILGLVMVIMILLPAAPALGNINATPSNATAKNTELNNTALDNKIENYLTSSAFSSNNDTN